MDETPPAPAPQPINRTAASKEELEVLKQAWVQSAARIGEAERAARQTEADIAGVAESLRRLETSKLKKLRLMVNGSLQTSRDELAERMDNLKVLLERHRAELAAAQSARVALKASIAEMEAELKKPKLCENRLNDFKGLYG